MLVIGLQINSVLLINVSLRNPTGQLQPELYLGSGAVTVLSPFQHHDVSSLLHELGQS